jgi:hypothetical protein
MKRNCRPVYLVIALTGSILLSFSVLAADTGKLPEKIGIEPPYFEVPKNHAAMHRAVLEARKTVGKFIAGVLSQRNIPAMPLAGSTVTDFMAADFTEAVVTGR